MRKRLLLFMLFTVLSLPVCHAEETPLYWQIHREVSSYNAQNADWITQAILYSSSVYGVDPLLITAVMEQESGFHLESVSRAGAIGAMQLMPSTAEMIGVDPYNPLDNIIGGTIYLKNQLDRFSDRGEYAVSLALAAYNAGPQAVLDYDVYIPYAETRNYVSSIANIYERLLAA